MNGNVQRAIAELERITAQLYKVVPVDRENIDKLQRSLTDIAQVKALLRGDIV